SYLDAGIIYVPRKRIRVALVEKRTAEDKPEQDHLRYATKKVEGPFDVFVTYDHQQVRKFDSDGLQTTWADYWVDGKTVLGTPVKRYPTIEAAKEAAEAEAARLNAKWREEQEARRKADEISPELRRRLETKISGVILREDLG